MREKKTWKWKLGRKQGKALQEYAWKTSTEKCKSVVLGTGSDEKKSNDGETSEM